MKHVKRTKNFTKFNIDLFFKFGGSLTKDLDNCKELLSEIIELSKENRILIFPGGGLIDNLIEEINDKFELSDYVHHLACARAQDQTGLILSNFYPAKFKIITKFSELEETYNESRIPILLPLKVIEVLDPFEKSWEISSDTMGAYFSYILECEKMITLTNVYGIYSSDPTKNKEAKIIKEIHVSDLKDMGHTAVDETFAEFLENASMDAYILNGKDTENFKNFFKNKKALYSKVIGGE